MSEKDTKLKQRLWTAAEHAAPDPLERILSACEEPRKEEQQMKNARTTNSIRRRWVSLTAAAMLAVLVGLGAGIQGWRSGQTVASVVSLDVNPSIQLQVNRKERVLSAEPLNADAWTILKDMELEGTQLNVAVNAIVGSLLQNGYLAEAGSAILISVEDSDAQRAGRLEAELNQTVSAAVEKAVVLSQVLTYDAGQTPGTAGVSAGKAALVQSIQALNGSLVFEDLAALSVEELWQLRDAGAPGQPIGMAEAALAAQAYANVLETDSFVWEADAELDEIPAHYEVELYQPHNKDLKYEYRVDAYTGEVLTGPANILQTAGDSTETPGTAPAPSQKPAADTAGTGSGTRSLIGEAQAKSIALRHAGLQESGTLYCNVWAEYDEGRMEHYEVEFGTDSARYEYEIGLYDGAVLKSEQKAFAAPSAPSASSGTAISEARAKEIAFAHAGVQAADVVMEQMKLDWEDGVQVYELEFRAGNTEYEYEIAAAGGAVLKAERDTEPAGTHHPESGGHVSHIGMEAAKAAALRHAGVAAGDAWDMKCELDCDDGRYLYEVEFDAGGLEYEYEIDAETGAVLKAERDS
ncbi:PepSY domain-containing protein [uncultured Oscillibacter sp.]|uniref:PepSY domain-containing protein n=1 Tax=uncultured Oscillibacter sp. TaxID=876091 RepID=UPI00260311A2|nr:PepSY domain-containing protein [uncultured Oscillibacter sp.]